MLTARSPMICSEAMILWQPAYPAVESALTFTEPELTVPPAGKSALRRTATNQHIATVSDLESALLNSQATFSDVWC